MLSKVKSAVILKDQSKLQSKVRGLSKLAHQSTVKVIGFCLSEWSKQSTAKVRGSALQNKLSKELHRWDELYFFKKHSKVLQNVQGRIQNLAQGGQTFAARSAPKIFAPPRVILAPPGGGAKSTPGGAKFFCGTLLWLLYPLWIQIKRLIPFLPHIYFLTLTMRLFRWPDWWRFSTRRPGTLPYKTRTSNRLEDCLGRVRKTILTFYTFIMK